MVLWIGFAVLAAAVVWAVTRPLLAARGSVPARARQRARRLQGSARRDRGRARARPDRRHGSRGRARRGGAPSHPPRRGERASPAPRRRGRLGPAPASVLWSAAALPVLALAIYLAVGSPGLPGRPYAARLNEPVEQASAADLVAKVEAHLRQHPDDGRGWDVLAPVYMRTGRFPAGGRRFRAGDPAAGRVAAAARRLCARLDHARQRRRGGARAPGVRKAARARARRGRAARCGSPSPRSRTAISLAPPPTTRRSPRRKPEEPWSSLLEERIEEREQRSSPIRRPPRRPTRWSQRRQPATSRTSTP